jgi:hypothetical protein
MLSHVNKKFAVYSIYTYIYPMVGFGKDIEGKPVGQITSSVIDKPYRTLNACIERSWIFLICSNE